MVRKDFPHGRFLDGLGRGMRSRYPASELELRVADTLEFVWRVRHLSSLLHVLVVSVPKQERPMRKVILLGVRHEWVDEVVVETKDVVVVEVDAEVWIVMMINFLPHLVCICMYRS